MSKVMIISEKPTAARKIAMALDEQGSPKETKKEKISYFECYRGGDSLVVVYALGHLYELKQTEKGWNYPKMDMEWVPKYEVDKKATNIKRIIQLISRLSKEIDRFVVATDYDIEGSLIGYLTLKYACKTDPNQAQRMLFSTLTKVELESAFDKVSPTLDFPMIEAGQVRHEIDWLYGINLTRALTLAIKNVSGWFKIVSTGRVQGPSLAFVAERNIDTNLFVPIPFWIINIIGSHDGHEFKIEYQKKRVICKSTADSIVSDLQDKYATVKSVRESIITQPPPVPFNLSGLQTEAYRLFRYKPSKTLAIAQKLYLDALISYPRTNSQKIPKTIDLKAILTGLSSMRSYKGIARQILREELKPVQGERDDPAHPAIHPTGERPTRRLTQTERKLFDLIVKRFFALFGKPSKKASMRVDLECGGHGLFLRGLRIIERGWMEYYSPYAYSKEVIIPVISEDAELQLIHVSADEQYTSPPARYNHSSLLKKLERENLGTKATRSSIIDSLKSRGYTIGDNFELSTLGYAVYETLKQYAPQVLSVDMTRHLELEMEAIQKGVRTRNEVLSKARRDLAIILDDFKSKEEMIGASLINGLRRYWREKEVIGPCPKCEDGTLMIIQSPKTGKRFIGCSNYRDKKCDQTFPLPQKGRIVPLQKECPFCGHQMIKIVSRRTWETCVNWTKCLGRAEDLKVLDKKRRRSGVNNGEWSV